MREIWFRLWDTISKEFVDPQEYSISLAGSLWHEETGVTQDQEILILSQFTRCRDSKRVRIYEGDILLTPGGQKLPVVIDDLILGDGKFWSIDPSTCKKIGNIYQNPELIGDPHEQS